MFTHPRRLSAGWLIASFAAALVCLVAGCGGDKGPVTASSSKYKPAESTAEQPAEDGATQAGSADAAVPTAPRKVNIKTNGAKPAAADAAAADAVPESPFAGKAKSETNAKDGEAASGKYPLPKGDAAALAQFFKEMGQREPQGNTRQEMLADLIAIQEARLAAAKKALSGELDKDVRKNLVEESRNIYILFMQVNVPQASEKMHAFVADLVKSPQPDTQEIGRHQAFQLKVMEIVQSQPEDASEIIAELKQFVEAEKKSVDAYETAEEICGALRAVQALQSGLVEALTFLGETYKDNPDESVAARAKGHLDLAKAMQIDLPSKFEAVIQKKPEADEQLLAAFKELLTDGNLSATLFEQTKQIAYLLEAQLDRGDLSLQILDEAAAAYKDAPIGAKVATAAESAKKRVGLIGQPLTVEGVLPDGTPFDWKAYEGKIVLVDFWATWCGPCLEEIPNIARNYRRYKEQGFEVVGISLDFEIDSLIAFTARQPLPWTVIVSQELFDKKTIESNKPDTHPLARDIGIPEIGIPFVVLVGKDGKVDSIHVRGEKLSNRLAELLGDPAPSQKPAAKPADKPAEERPGEKPPTKDKPAEKAPKEDGQGGCGAAEPAADAAAETEEESKINPYTARPGLSVADLVKYIDKMLDKPKTIQGRPGFAEALCEACDRVLAANPPPSEADLLLAAETKFETLHKAACGGDTKADEQLAAFCEQMKADARPKIAARVAFFALERKVLEGDKLPPEQIGALLKELSDYFAKESLTARHLRMASSTVALINRIENGEDREKHFVSFGSAFAKSSDKELARYGKKLAKKPAAKESDLVGKELELAGATAAGAAFDWKKYRGKVVLVDFWATWCGPCLREMPHVRELYDRLHAKGFEVVGVSLDKDAEALSTFLDENQLPWETLAGDETQELAEKYGVRGIPTMMVVDKEGKVLGVAHQVQQLVPIIEKALP
jgi:thiol-disulfide isomerase/thioredoxin